MMLKSLLSIFLIFKMEHVKDNLGGSWKFDSAWRSFFTGIVYNSQCVVIIKCKPSFVGFIIAFIFSTNNTFSYCLHKGSFAATVPPSVCHYVPY